MPPTFKLKKDSLHPTGMPSKCLVLPTNSSYFIFFLISTRDPLADGIPEEGMCRYPGFQEPEPPYDMNLKYWMITSARLAFVLCFVVFVFFVKFVVMYVVPDIPNTLQLKIKREKFLATQADIQHKEKTGKRVTLRRQPTVPSEGAESEML